MSTSPRRRVSRMLAPRVAAGVSVVLAILAVWVPSIPAGADDVLCDGLVATMVGTEVPDTLIGTAGDDVIAGLGGDDTIRGGPGADRICGGDGYDLIEGGQGDDREFGEGANDVFQTSEPVIVRREVNDNFGDNQGEGEDYKIDMPPGTIGDINVRVDVDHSSPSDLSIFLTSPDGVKSKMVENATQVAPGTGFNGTLFDSEAIVPIQNANGADLRGRFHPANSLDAPYRYKQAGGQWRLNVKDIVVTGIADGFWNWWELEIVYVTNQTDGSDLYDGGDGTQDLVDYTARVHDLKVSLNAQANDGAAGLGEVDDGTPRSEWIYSGFGKDRLVGNSQFNDLRSGSGNDVITGKGGDDRFRGGNGNDKEYGNTGDDKLDGNDGNDFLDGGPGTDQCISGETKVSCEP